MLKNILVSLFIITITTGNIHAQENIPKSYDEFPQSGVLAANGNLPGGSLALPQLPMGLLGQAVPVLGSISLNKERNWVFSVSNNADKALKVSVEIIQFDGNRNRLSGSSYQYKLAPGAKGEGKVSAPTHSAAAALMLKSWSWQNKR